MDVGVKELLNYELMEIKKWGCFLRKNVWGGSSFPLSLSAVSPRGERGRRTDRKLCIWFVSTNRGLWRQTSVNQSIRDI